MDIVVSGGSDPDRPVPAPQPRRSHLLELLTVGVFLVAAATAYTGWTVHQSQQDNRVLTCSFYVDNGDGDGRSNYDDMSEGQQAIVDRLDCDVPGR